MNHPSREALADFVESVVAPVRATRAAKRRMREELLAHATGVFDEEMARQGLPADRPLDAGEAALRAALARLGAPGELAHELQQTVTPWNRWLVALEAHLRVLAGWALTWFGFRVIYDLLTYVSGPWLVDGPVGPMVAIGLLSSLATGLLLARVRVVSKPMVTVPLIVLASRLPSLSLEFGPLLWWTIFSYDLSLAALACLGCWLARRTPAAATLPVPE